MWFDWLLKLSNKMRGTRNHFKTQHKMISLVHNHQVCLLHLETLSQRVTAGYHPKPAGAVVF